MKRLNPKSVINLIVLLILIINMSFFISSKTLAMKEVKYDSELTEYFKNQTLVEKTIIQKELDSYFLEIVNNKTWIDVIIKVKDFSNITISGKDSIEIQKVKDQQRNKIFNDVTNSILLTLSEEDFRYKDRTISGRTFFGYVTEEGFNKLLNNSNIRAIYLEEYIPVSLSESAPLINATYVWNVLNYTGEGQSVCVIDTGIDYTHPDLGGCTQEEFLSGNCDKVPGGYDYVLINDADPMDTNGHGTHVAGIIASENLTYRGIAPDSKIAAVRVCMTLPIIDFVVCLKGNIEKGLEWCYQNRSTLNITVVSMSIGAGKYGPGNCTEDFADDEINDLYNVDIPVVVASGNEGYTDGIAYPACNDNVISVGATTKQDNIWDYTTGIGTNRAGNLDLLAPGGNIIGSHSCPTNDWICSTQLDGGFIGYTGTSMAAPHVAGVVALMLEKNSTLTPNEIKEILIDTGKDRWDPDTQTNYPRIDAKAAVNNVSYCTYSSWTSGSCGPDNGCFNFQRKYTRTANPANCTSTTKCEYDESCIGGDTITVCKGGGCDYTTIQSALNNALSDDIIKVTDSAIYNEKLNWSTSSDWVLLNCQGATITAVGWAVFAEDISDWAMINCIINSTAGIKIHGSGSGHEILNNMLDIDEHGIEAIGPDVSRFYIWDNLIFNGADEGVYFHGDSTDTPRTGYIYRNNFFNNGKGIWLKRTQWNEVFNNTFKDNNYGIYFTGDSYSLDNTVQDNNLTENDYGVYMENQGYTTLTNNIICYSNSTYDIYANIVTSSYGIGNTCERSYVWNDTGKVGCTYYCDSGATTTLIYPNDNSTYITKDNVELVCLSEDNNQLANVTLYHNITGTWQANQTKQISGTSNISVFNINVLNGTKFDWNCLAYDNVARGSFANTNWSINVIVDTTAPNVNIMSPLNQTYNVSSINFNVSLNEEGSCKYFLNKGITNITMGTNDNKNFSSANSSIAIGGYLSNFYCEDGVGNVNNTKSVSFSISTGVPPNDTSKFYIKNSSGSNVAWLGSEGNIVLKGTCTAQATCTAPANSFIIANYTDSTTAYIDSNGNMCVEKGDCSDESTNCNSPADGAFIMANSTNYVSYIDGEGDLCLIGTLYQNSEP